MRSVRFDAELEERVMQAAEVRGMSVSEFIRAAVRRECDEALHGDTRREGWKALLTGPHADDWARALDGVVGVVDGGDSSREEDLDDWARAIRDRNWRA